MPAARAGLADYFAFYNHERPHQALAYRTPAEVYGEVPCGGAREPTVRMLMGMGCGHVEISQTRFPQAHPLHHLNKTETTLTSSTP